MKGKKEMEKLKIFTQKQGSYIISHGNKAAPVARISNVLGSWWMVLSGSTDRQNVTAIIHNNKALLSTCLKKLNELRNIKTWGLQNERG